MLLSHLQYIVRRLRREAGYSAINLFGLTIGLASVLLIGLFVREELSWDGFHEKSDRIVRMRTTQTMSDGRIDEWNETFGPVADVLREQVPGVSAAVRVQRLFGPLVSVGENAWLEEDFLRAEPTFFEMFDFPLVAGSAAELARPGTIILSESTARKLFGAADPIGQRLTAGGRWSTATTEYEVVGVMADMPGNTHLKANYVASYQLDADNPWRTIAFTYVLLEPGVQIADMMAAFRAIDDGPVIEHVSGRRRLVAQPLSDIHLYPAAANDLGTPGDIRYVFLFSGIALVILVIAGINYVNLAMARSVRRMAEVGVRKSIGAGPAQLMGQFLSEALLLSAVAVVLAVILADASTGWFSRVMDRSLDLPLTDGVVLAGIVLVTLLLGLGAGLLPAVRMARTSPLAAFRGGHGAVPSRSLARRGLVVFQFAASLALIASTLIIQNQLAFVQNARLGFAPDQTLVLATRGALGENGSAFKERLAGIPAIGSVGGGSAVPGVSTGIMFFDEGEIEDYVPPENDALYFNYIMADASFGPSLGTQLVAGRWFREGETDTGVLVNEATVRRLGWDSALGKTFTFGSGPRPVIGVFENIHMEALHKEVLPMIMTQDEAASRHVVLNVAGADVPGVLAAVEGVWKEFLPDQPFAYSFLDDEFAAMYADERRLARLLGGFSAVAILIALIGLFGLASYAAERRTKEIGIRKVLGASVGGIVGLLSREFVAMVAVAFVVSTPVAWMVMSRWLETFAYRMDITWTLFAWVGLAGLVLAVATVGVQATRAALANPVESLRSE
jgi:putative ABC transport system permease protein